MKQMSKKGHELGTVIEGDIVELLKSEGYDIAFDIPARDDCGEVVAFHVFDSEDALDHATSIEDLKSDLTVYWKCAGCDFPHLSEQQAINCCPPVQVFCCPQCGGLRYSEYEARECCR